MSTEQPEPIPPDEAKGQLDFPAAIK